MDGEQEAMEREGKAGGMSRGESRQYCGLKELPLENMKHWIRIFEKECNGSPEKSAPATVEVPEPPQSSCHPATQAAALGLSQHLFIPTAPFVYNANAVNYAPFYFNATSCFRSQGHNYFDLSGGTKMTRSIYTRFGFFESLTYAGPVNRIDIHASKIFGFSATPSAFRKTSRTDMLITQAG